MPAIRHIRASVEGVVIVGPTGFVSVIIVSALFALGLPLVLL